MRVDRTQTGVVTLIPENAQDVIDLVEARNVSPKKLADKHQVEIGQVLNLTFIKGTVSFRRDSDFKFERLPS